MFPGFPDNPGLPRRMPQWQPQPAPGQLRSARPRAMRYQRYQGGIGQVRMTPLPQLSPPLALRPAGRYTRNSW